MDTRDIIEIHQLEALAHHAVDHSDQSVFELVFTQDAVFDATASGGPRFEGLDAIKGFFALGKPPHPPAHHMTNIWVYEKDGRICVKMKWFCPVPSGDGTIFGGDNDDWVVRTPDGWRIKERVSMMRYGTP